MFPIESCKVSQGARCAKGLLCYFRRLERKKVFLGGFLSKKEAVFTACVRGDGKLTVPKSVRDSLDIEEKDLVECKICKVKSARRI